MNGVTPIAERRLAVQLLTEIEEAVIVSNILNLHARGLPPWVEGVDDMANRIIATPGTKRAEKLWSHCFIKRREEFKTRFSRAYDFQRTLCEDSDVISAWFWDADTHWSIADADPWVSWTTQNLTEALSQSMLLQTQAINYK